MYSLKTNQVEDARDQW